jgi:serine protease Do
MKNRPMLAAVVLVGIGVILGVGLVSTFEHNTLSTLFAQATAQIKKSDIGAKQAPVKVESSAQVLNNAFKAVSKAVNPSVVSITVTTERKADPRRRQFEDFFGFRMPNQPDGDDDGVFRSQGAGSGVFVTGDGYIITNNHVVEDAKKSNGIEVTTFDNHKYEAKLIGRDENTDIAVIKIEPKSGESFAAACIANSDEVQVGEWVVAVGNPLGLNSTVTAGIVSAIGRGRLGLAGRDQYSIENYIQTDAAINPGNSGGGLFDLEGKLIGINTAIATRTGGYQGYGFAVPSNLVKAVALDLMDDGKVNRGFIGVQITTVDEATAKAVGLDKVAGAMVQSLVEKGAAKAAGIEEGDVILEVDGYAVNSSNELQSRIGMRRAGDKVALTIWRNKQRITKSVTLKARDDDKNVAANTDPSAGEEKAGKETEGTVKPVTLDNLGLTVEPLDNDDKKALDVQSGVMVSKVVPYSIAANALLAPNTIITKAGGQAVTSPKQLKEILSSKKAGEAVLLQVKFKGADNKVATRLVGIEIPRKDG